MSFRRYAEYRDSGVEWLGEVPAGWEVKLLKFTATINDDALLENTDPDFEFDYVDIGSVDYVEGISSKETMTFENAPSRARRIVQSGDTIVSTVRTYLRAIASIGEFDKPLIVSTGFAVVRPKTVYPNFLAYALKASSFVQSIVARSVGVSYPAINASEVGAIFVPIPSKTEQIAIATFLDRETAKIDALVAKQEQLIELLREKRQAVISHAVTKGLESNAKMKDSGVEWLGEVPKHWEMKRGRFCTDVNPRSFHSLHPDSEVSFVPMEAVGEYGGLNLDQTRYVFEVSSGYTEFKDGDVVVAKITPCFENGKGAIATGLLNGIGFGTTELHVLRPFANLDVHFLFYFSISQVFRSMGEGEMYGAGGQKRVPSEFCKDIQISLPPLEEQKQIVAFLDKETEKIDILIEKSETAIRLLKERRTALISAAVTGEIDVRDEA